MRAQETALAQGLRDVLGKGHKAGNEQAGTWLQEPRQCYGGPLQLIRIHEPTVSKSNVLMRKADILVKWAVQSLFRVLNKL